jgi:MYST family zinc finger domain/RNA binding activity-knot of a chromodomain
MGATYNPDDGNRGDESTPNDIVGSENKGSATLSTTMASSSVTIPPPPSAMDLHPYARGSVIEVLHGGNDILSKEIFWWSDSEDDKDVNYRTEELNSMTETEGVSVRLCDVIDRVTDGVDKWRYYVHYRDFNRRMDEWIGMEKIVSPPSVGNAKARALKKQEEKMKRKLAKLEEEKQAAAESLQTRGPRSARRSTSDAIMATGSTSFGSDEMTSRMTRRQRRKTDVLDSQLSTPDGGADSDTPLPMPTEPDKEVVTILKVAKAETTVVGQHVVATIPAQELDEHEGLDEASLREHEEVTKVKNVAFLELGEYRMETWYFTPLPKELLSERGFVEVLYVCEFSLNMFSRKSELLRYHAREFPKNRRHPPGNEIYRHDNLASK